MWAKCKGSTWGSAKPQAISAILRSEGARKSNSCDLEKRVSVGSATCRAVTLRTAAKPGRHSSKGAEGQAPFSPSLSLTYPHSQLTKHDPKSEGRPEYPSKEDNRERGKRRCKGHTATCTASQLKLLCYLSCVFLCTRVQETLCIPSNRRRKVSIFPYNPQSVTEVSLSSKYYFHVV